VRGGAGGRSGIKSTPPFTSIKKTGKRQKARGNSPRGVEGYSKKARGLEARAIRQEPTAHKARGQEQKKRVELEG